ncbi:MAG: hypothetical protein J6R59_01465 [Paludibacteraceae bacterium]|nr:hypothetical protein [Paludibacteraceae bacterium]
MARSKKKVTEVVEKVEDVISPTPKKKVVKKDKTAIETVSQKKKTRKVITGNPIENVKDEIKPTKKVHKTNDDIIIEPPKKRTRKKTKDEVASKTTKEEEPKLASTPPPKVQKKSEPSTEEEPKKVEPPKPKVQKVSEPRKPKKPILKVKDFYEFEEGKYVLGDVEELFDEKLLKKMKTSIKKLSKKNHGKDDKLGIHYFKVGDKVWDCIEYNNKILTASNSLILCKSETVTKEGKLRFCKRFEAKEKFNVFVDYTKDDYCLYFYYEDAPGPFMMLQDEALI